MPLFAPVAVLLAQLHELTNRGALVCIKKEVHALLSLVSAAEYYLSAPGGTVNRGVGEFKLRRHSVSIVDAQ
jgi:hypothetical protein